MNYLLPNRIFTISGDVQCKKCKKVSRLRVDEPGPPQPKCRFCDQENSAKSAISVKKKKMMNWLFLLQGQTLCCLTLKQLKYFCAHTKIHRTGPKDRILYCT
ncbi:hypothetical protein NL676_015807 [Syzygium grande]|nr:hypothetical protein NL676_015807 [Syzygium grande]